MTTAIVIRRGTYSLRFAMGPTLAVALLAVGLASEILWALTQGTEPIALRDMSGVLTPSQSLVLTEFRGPRVVLAALCGAMLALAGATMQGLTRNDLADPGIMGVREGAALGIVAGMIAYPALPLWWRPLLGLGAGLAAGLFVLSVARGASGLKTVLFGIALSWCLSAILVILLSIADLPDLQSAMIWLAGQFQAADWRMVWLAAAILLPTLAILLFLSRQADVHSLSPQLAIGLGVQSRRLMRMRLLCATLLVAGAVSVAGGIGFVGLIAPHLARACPKGSGRATLLHTALIGAMLVLAADTFGRTLFAPVEIPTGIALAVLGAPTLIVLIWMRRNRP